MYLVILPFVAVGLFSKLYTAKTLKNHPNINARQIDLIIASFFTSIKPEDFEDESNERKIDQTTKKAGYSK